MVFEEVVRSKCKRKFKCLMENRQGVGARQSYTARKEQRSVKHHPDIELRRTSRGQVEVMAKEFQVGYCCGCYSERYYRQNYAK
ncbi:hypothetical protein G7K_1253-t1 [Saitoella complicata NRRL Y-17804]|uniref:Uncharacterized protein n=1 Tax=Saitoella complicata (strain BCRC 22490 / CBS 7301 / JCM 7358 / NBRC 10748 / NRRL Y-17804) TaxID=698492 RepID=A0A0E9NCA6_SAICN|nr:hypothetical protein G7K_1253-t1 [Saitoella complicata NRRL Y-17804]